MTEKLNKPGGTRPGAGRKPDPVAGKTITKNVTLDALTIEKLKAYGDGNLSLGIRKMVRAFFSPI